MRMEMLKVEALTNASFAHVGTFNKRVVKDIQQQAAIMRAKTKDNYINSEVNHMVSELDTALARLKHLHKIRYKVSSKQRKAHIKEAEIVAKGANDLIKKITLLTGKNVFELGIFG